MHDFSVAHIQKRADFDPRKLLIVKVLVKQQLQK